MSINITLPPAPVPSVQSCYISESFCPLECIVPSSHIPFFKCVLLIMLLQLSRFFLPFIPLHAAPPPTSIPPRCSCAWVVHISSLASPFPIIILTSLYATSTRQVPSVESASVGIATWGGDDGRGSKPESSGR